MNMCFMYQFPNFSNDVLELSFGVVVEVKIMEIEEMKKEINNNTNLNIPFFVIFIKIKVI